MLQSLVPHTTLVLYGSLSLSLSLSPYVRVFCMWSSGRMIAVDASRHVARTSSSEAAAPAVTLEGGSDCRAGER